MSDTERMNQLPRIGEDWLWERETASRQTVLSDARLRRRLAIMPNLDLMRPVLDGRSIRANLLDVEQIDSGMILRFESPAARWQVRIVVNGPCLDMQCHLVPARDCQLNRLELFPAGTILNFDDLVNFRNRHFAANTWPELNLGQGFQTDTYSRDWQFAPHPSLFVLRKEPTNLLAALADLPAGTFGMHLAVKDFRVRHWYLDYGPQPHGLKLLAEQPFDSPRLRLMLRHDESVYDTLDAFTATLVRDGQIPNPIDRESEPWWTQPLYCTWTDQNLKANTTVATDLHMQSIHPDTRPGAVLSEGLVREVATVIRREQLPFHTILIDEGWAVARGEWRPHPQRFPNMREMVDDLHAQGFKVMIWLAWPEVFDDASVPAEFLCGNGSWRNAHGRRFMDYSSRVTQNDYLRPLMHQLLSGDRGCYDLDGLKTDFQADKVHPELPLADPSWRGEENYLVRVTRLFYEELKRHKPDGMHLGCAGHFWCAPYIDLNRTYDVHSSNWREHEQRALMLRHTTPGCPVSYDFHGVLENMEEWFASARRLGAAVEIGNVLYVRDDPFSDPRPADDQYYRTLRRCLANATPPC